MSEYFEGRHKRVNETYAKMLADIQQEKIGANILLDKMVSNSKETVVNLQQYFAEVMDSTMEKTYTDIKVILANAVNKIDSVSRNIKDSLRSNKDDVRVNQNIVENQKSLAKLIGSGIDSIKKLAYKFKNDVPPNPMENSKLNWFFS